MDETDFRVVAIISAHNEGDVISAVIADLVRQGLFVYLIDHCSTDTTIAEAEPWLGRGLLQIERFPEDAGYPEENRKQYLWAHILRRKEELAASIDADWFIHHDADEYRESPWEGVPLVDAIRAVDRLGYNAIGFAQLDFHPVDSGFIPGTDVRESLRYFEWGEAYKQLQVKAWKRQPRGVNLVGSGGHCVAFAGKKTYPVRFILRHYPVRSQQHGIEKVFSQRKQRFSQREKGAGWHVHYDHIQNEEFNFLRDPGELTLYDPQSVREQLLQEDAAFIAAALVTGRVGTEEDLSQQAQDALKDEYLSLSEFPLHQDQQHATAAPRYEEMMTALSAVREAEAKALHPDPLNSSYTLRWVRSLWHFCRIRIDLALSVLSRRGNRR